LALLGFTSAEPILYQASNFAAYSAALTKLGRFLYPCICTRADLQDADIYPGHCRDKTIADIPEGTPYALRINMGKALKHLKAQQNWPLIFTDAKRGDVTAAPEEQGDVILARKEFKTSYHLSVVVDDAAQGITHIIRGADLYEMTHIHRLLQALLGLPVPHYTHHGLIVEVGNQKLSKSAASMPLNTLVKNGLDLVPLKKVFENVQSIDDEPAEAFIKALPSKIAEPLEFKPFK
jgi:glutamyl-Q tRNA(Asp) synthetase